jgi:protein subunit release factor B
MAITHKKLEDIQKLMEEMGIHESDLIEKFIIGSGKGGQKIQKTSSCVYLKHIPTGIEIKCQKDRLRETNRYLARKMLCERIKEKVFHEKSEKQKLIEKIRRQKQRKTRKQKQKMIENKRHLSEKKQLRHFSSSEE